MKVQNPTKLDIFFKGGGIIKFPVQNLKQIDVEPIDEQGGGSSVDLTTLEYDDIKSYYIDFLLRVKNNNELIRLMGSQAFEFITDTDDYLKNNIVFPDVVLLKGYDEDTGTPQFVRVDDLYFGIFQYNDLQSGNSYIMGAYSYNNLEAGKYYVLTNGFILKYTGDPEIDEQYFGIHEITTTDGNICYTIEAFG